MVADRLPRAGVVLRRMEPVAARSNVKWRVDLATYNVDLLPRTDALAALARYRSKLEANVRGYRDLEGFLVDSGCPQHRLALARRPIRILEGEIAWLDDFIRELESGAQERVAPEGAPGA